MTGLLVLLALFAIALGLASHFIFLPAVRKSGFSGWWLVLALVPFAGVILLWVWALSPWPNVDGAQENELLR